MKSVSALAAVAAASGFVAVSASPSLAQPGGGWGWHMWNGGGWMFLGPLVWIIVIVAVVALIVYAVRGSGGGGGFTAIGSSKTPREILDERFARGEIDKKEYEERKKVLEG